MANIVQAIDPVIEAGELAFEMARAYREMVEGYKEDLHYSTEDALAEV